MAQASSQRPAVPRPSATVALVRDGARGPELLLVLRHSKTTFGDSYVFPGGLLETQDFAVAGYCDGSKEADANAVLGVDADGLAYYSAAIRELFEESGVLLARGADGAWAHAARFQACRDDLAAGRLRWPRFLESHGLRLACDALLYFSHWITPREASKRFSTRFFVAVLPPGQRASHCGTELTDSRWLTPAAALEGGDSAELRLPRPTEACLRSLQRFDDLASLLAWARGESASGVRCVQPAIIDVAGESRIVMPGDQLYPDYGRRDE